MKTIGVRAGACLVALLVALGAHSALSVGSAVANTGCPESTSNLGDINLTGTCTINTDTTWENGTLSIAGNVVINSGVTLTLQNVTIRFDPAFDDEFGVEVYGSLSMQGGGAESANANKWDLITGTGSTVVIDGSEFANGHYDFSGAVSDIGYSTFRDSDLTSGGQHIRVGAYSRFHHSVLRDISLAEDAAIFIYRNWGESSIWGNQLYLNCYGRNCMGIEVRDMQEEATAVYPGFPVVEVGWNNVTWEEIGSGDWAISFDNEYSSRIYIHNNTQYVNATLESAGNCLQGGGVRRGSIYENNTCYGPGEYGIWNYIYSDTDNVFQYNHFSDMEYGGIFQVGTATVAHNALENVGRAAIWICPTGGGCAGASAVVADNTFYNNTVTYAPGGYIARASLSNMFDNTLILHGNGQATQWSEGGSGPYHTVFGDGNWLYWANGSIEKLQFVNTTSGTRQVIMGVGGSVYHSEYAGFGTTDNASLTVEGSLDGRGSSNYDDSGTGTFLWLLGPQRTEVDVLGTGSLDFTVGNFAANWDYSVSIWDYGSSQTSSQTFTTDDSGNGIFSIASAGHYRVTIDSDGTPPPELDETPPGQVADLGAVDFGVDYAVLQWTAPGDDGVSGQASTYDIRYSTGGAINEANFAGATPVPVQPPPPSPSGSTETMNVTGLSPDTNYWFALRTADEIPNWSPVSNNGYVTTLPPPDESPPAQVTDLDIVVANSEYVILQWRAPGDDGSLGQAATYDIRYSTAGSLNETNFDSAPPVPVGVPSPAAAGSTERLNVSGLSPGTEYWFALRTADEVPNWSPVSNSVNATTPLNETEVDDTAPTVTIVSPSEGDIISDNVIITVEAVDDTSVVEVSIFVNGNLRTTMNEAPYQWIWLTTGVPAGYHTIRAEAADPTGNVGWREIQVVVLPRTPGLPESEGPTVESVSYDPTEERFYVQFSKPMNRTSVEEALDIEPHLPYTTSWTDDANLTVVLQEAPQAGSAYVLLIDWTAADSEGTTLAEAFAFHFSGVGGEGETLTFGNLWLQIVMLLAAAWVVVVSLLLWSRRGIKRLRLNVRQLATQIEELNSKPSTPGEIKVYHRY